MAELKQAALSFRQHKLLLTKSYRKLHRYIVEQCIESLQGHRMHMIGLFRDIVIDCHRDELMTPLMSYFKNEEAEYMHYLQVLDSAVVIWVGLYHQFGNPSMVQLGLIPCFQSTFQ